MPPAVGLYAVYGNVQRLCNPGIAHPGRAHFSDLLLFFMCHRSFLRIGMEQSPSYPLVYRFARDIRNGPKCYHMPDKQREVLLKLMDAFPDEKFTIRNVSELTGLKYRSLRSM